MKLFWSWVQENKIFTDLPNFTPFCPLLGPLWGPRPFSSQTWSGFPWGCFVLSLVEIHPLVLEKKSFKEEFHIWPFFGPLWAPKGAKPFFSAQLCIVFPRGCYIPNLVEIGQNWIFAPFWTPLEGAIFDPIFCLFANFVALALKIVHIKYEVIWTSGSWEENFLRFT